MKSIIVYAHTIKKRKLIGLSTPTMTVEKRTTTEVKQFNGIPQSLTTIYYLVENLLSGDFLSFNTYKDVKMYMQTEGI